MTKYIFLDFNGTVLDDLDLCLELLNDLLSQQGKKPIDREKYRSIFRFPVIDYYVLAGLDVTDFEKQAKYFITEYTRRNVLECQVFTDFKEFADRAHQDGFKLVLCSASMKKLLIDQLKSFAIIDCFDDVIALDNYHAKSKVDVALKYIKDKDLKPEQLYFIGDTDHDALVAHNCNGKSILVSRGHQNEEIINKTGSVICNSLLSALDYLEKNAI